MKTLRIVSWNVNGIRSAERKGLLQWWQQAKPDVLCLQETRVDTEALPDALRHPLGYHGHWAFAEKKGYSGVATFSRKPALALRHGPKQPEYLREGRCVETEFKDFLLYNVYFPKGSGTERDNSRVPYKLGFYDALFGCAKRRSKQTGKPLIVVGDFNTAHQPIDLTNWKSNQKTSGFLPEEREVFARHLRGGGFVDTFRHHHPARAQYSWWSNRIGVRERNVGWRIDYVWVSDALLPRVQKAFIWDDVRGSDHAPVGIELRQ
jgi:exodeoxyribonuclease-3